MDYITMGHNVDFDQHGRRHRLRTPKLIYVIIAILAIGVILTLLNIYELHKMKEDHSMHHSWVSEPEVEGRTGKNAKKMPVVWVTGKKKESGYLKHVYNVFNRIGYVTGDENSDWEVLWAHDYPFVSLSKHLSDLKPHQKVNHFPGSGYITNKASLAATKMDFIPTAFKMPTDKENFTQYVKKHVDTMWVQKSNNHRGIEIKSVKDLNLNLEGTFIQEYVAKPYLIDGRKFDIGVYTILTSINPLRVYTVDGDVLFRFCAKNYYPFDSKDRAKYVVGDDYTPMWQIPSLKKAFTDMDFSFKETFNHHVRETGKDPEKIWSDIKSAILTVYKDKESKLIDAARKYKSSRNFFEMVRFDFVLDEDLKIYLMEANMSPNLSSSHFKENKLLYEHVVFNLLGLVGLARSVTSNRYESAVDVINMQVSDKDISVFPEICSGSCSQSCFKIQCKICHKCLTVGLKQSLKTAYVEHVNRGSCRRVFPPPIMNQRQALKWTIEKADQTFHNTHQNNRIMQIWFIGKCRLDASFCI
ncbi:hypothetical protein SNE40_008595 [Patella caerulea]|uniref:Uncharacterized protein n=1 Tax=Patella caerulea TaxID=87958 RepID=A0AAN8Q3V1_PATCE